jgi:hypothetical protein
MQIDLADGTLFGNDAGEDEIPDVLASYFVDLPAFKSFMSRTNRLQIARSRKGMGKSALLNKLAYDLESTEDPPIVIRATGAGLFGISKPETYDYLSLQNYWTKVLCARVNFEIGKSIGFSFSDQNMALVDSAEIAGFKDRNVIKALLSRIKISKIPIEIRSEQYTNHEELLKRALERDSNRIVWLLVDDIDSTYVNTPEQQALVSTFFSASRTLVRDIHNLYIRATVRTDVWTSFRNNEDLDKSEQYVIDIGWTAAELKTVLSKKIFAYLDRNYPADVKQSRLDYVKDADEILELAFDRKMQWGNSRVPPFRPIHIMSSGRPRWMAQLCRLAGQDASKQGRTRISKADISDVLKQYGRYRLNDLYKEHSHQFADLQKLIETFSNGKPRYDTNELLGKIMLNYANKVGANNVPAVDGYPYERPMQLAHFLYRIGFIAARREHIGHSEYAEFIRHEERPELLTDTRNPDDGLQWEIYPSYRESLSIRKPRTSTRSGTRPRHILGRRSTPRKGQRSA